MESEVQNKLGIITDVWNEFILEYNFCSSRIRFDEDAKTNYLGDILGYFRDTYQVVFETKKPSDFSGNFAFSISFLQAIYIQQDFVEEMLTIFGLKINKGDLKKDLTYYINRDIRNELVGHPIRKINGRLFSSTLFSSHVREDEIQYLRYHVNNNFKFEDMTFKISEIRSRHQSFLEKYFELIIAKLKTVVISYLKALTNLEYATVNSDFKKVLNLAEYYFETIFGSDYLYEKNTLLQIYDRRHEHRRYENLINRFNNDLVNALVSVKEKGDEIFQQKIYHVSKHDDRIVKTMLINQDDYISTNKSLKLNCNYEIGKLADKKDEIYVKFFMESLKTKYIDNGLVLSEIEHMEKNFDDEIEYYSALRLVCAEIQGNSDI